MAEMIKKRTGNNKAEWSEDALRMLKELATAKVQGRPYSDPNLGYVQKMIPLLEVEPRGKPPEEYFRFQRKKKGMPPPRAMPSPSDGSTMSEHDRKKLAKECSSIYQERASIYDGHDLEREYELREELIEHLAADLFSLSGGWCYFCPLSDFRSDIVSLYELKMARKMGE